MRKKEIENIKCLISDLRNLSKEDLTLDKVNEKIADRIYISAIKIDEPSQKELCEFLSYGRDAFGYYGMHARNKKELEDYINNLQEYLTKGTASFQIPSSQFFNETVNDLEDCTSDTDLSSPKVQMKVGKILLESAIEAEKLREFLIVDWLRDAADDLMYTGNLSKDAVLYKEKLLDVISTLKKSIIR